MDVVDQEFLDTLENAKSSRKYVCISEDGHESEILILTAKVRHIPKVTKLLKKFIEMRGIVSVDQAISAAQNEAAGGLNIQTFMETVDEDLLDDIAEAVVSLTTITEKDVVLDMEIDDLFKVCFVIFEVNRDFFTKRLSLVRNQSQKESKVKAEGS